MRRTHSLVRVLTVLGMAMAVILVGHHAQRASGQAAGVGGISVVSVVADDPADSRFQAAYTYLIDAGALDGVTPSVAGSETYQLYDGVTGEILDSQPVGAGGSVLLTFARSPNDRHVININDPGTGSGPVGITNTVTVVINQGAGTEPTAEATTAPTTEATTAPTDQPTTAPATEPTVETIGSQAGIYAGTCDTEDFGDSIADLTSVAAPQGDEQGAAAFSPVQTSFSSVDVSLDDLLAEDHVVVVFDENDDAAPIACGAVGGTVADDGSLAFGLPAVADSGFSGVAYLAPDGDATSVTIFLAEAVAGRNATPEA